MVVNGELSVIVAQRYKEGSPDQPVSCNWEDFLRIHGTNILESIFHYLCLRQTKDSVR